MKTLLLLRHAKSSWDTPGMPDYDRPLAARGERDAPKVGKAFRSSGVELDLIVSSTARRARETAEHFASAAGYSGPIEYADEIYEASVSGLLGVVRRLPDEADTALLVGHNPGFEDLLSVLCGRDGAPARFRVPTATLACVELDGASWAGVGQGAGTLQWMIVPRLL